MDYFFDASLDYEAEAEHLNAKLTEAGYEIRFSEENYGSVFMRMNGRSFPSFPFIASVPLKLIQRSDEPLILLFCSDRNADGAIKKGACPLKDR